MRASIRTALFTGMGALSLALLASSCGTSGEPECPVSQLLCNGGCVDPRVDPSNCGGCGTACAAGQVCTLGGCSLTCATGLSACAGSCRDLMSDRAHCGACGNPCAAGLACFGGSCAPSCPANQVECGGTCTDTRFDPDNCGGCGGTCTAPANAQPACANGLCAHFCLPGFADCDDDEATGCEQDIASDENHCGACGAACGGNPANATTLCVGGACVVDYCADGFADCDTEFGNGCEAHLGSDPSHCGACQNACADGLICQEGACVDPPDRLVPGATHITVVRDGVEATCHEWNGNLCTQPKLRPLMLSCATYAYAGEWHAIHFDANFYCFYATGDRTVLGTGAATFTGPPTVHGHWSTTTCAAGAATEPHGYASGQLSNGTSLAWDYDRGAIGNIAAECVW